METVFVVDIYTFGRVVQTSNLIFCIIVHGHPIYQKNFVHEIAKKFNMYSFNLFFMLCLFILRLLLCIMNLWIAYIYSISTLDLISAHPYWVHTTVFKQIYL